MVTRYSLIRKSTLTLVVAAVILCVPLVETVMALTAVDSLDVISTRPGAMGGNNTSIADGWQMTPDGSRVVFASVATDLIEGEYTNGVGNIYLYDATSETVTLVSAGVSGVGGNGVSYACSISDDGTRIAYCSAATDLIGGMTTDSRWHNIYLYNTVTEQTTIVTRGQTNSGGNGLSSWPIISGNGGYIAFVSYANNLMPTPTDGVWTLFRYDIADDSFCLVTKGLTSLGLGTPQISTDGSKIAFASAATNLIPGGTTGSYNVYVYDAITEITRIASPGPVGRGGNGPSFAPSLSSDGMRVAFISEARDLISGVTVVGSRDIYFYDVATSQITLVTSGPLGRGGNGYSDQAVISRDGSHVSFFSFSTDLIPGFSMPAAQNVFLYNVETGHTTLVSAGASGTGGDGGSEGCALSSDGTIVFFASYATNLISGITTAKWTWNVYRFEVSTGELELITRGSQGAGGNGNSYQPQASADGLIMALESSATNLLSAGATTTGNIFLWSRSFLVTVTFDAQNGTALTQESVPVDTVVTEPVPPVRNGFTFAGWWTEPEGGRQWDFSTDTVSTDITLYAHWNEIIIEQYNVSYLPGTTDLVVGLPPGGSFAVGSLVTVGSAVTRAGYRFIGYQFAAADLVGSTLFPTRLLHPGDTFTMPATDVVATALWQRVWPVTFHPGNGDKSFTIEVDDGGKAIRPADPTRPGYEFVGWFTKDGTPYDFNTAVTGPLELYAVWRKLPGETPATGDTTTIASATLALIAAAPFVWVALRKRES